MHAFASARAGDVPHATFDAGAFRRTGHGVIDVARFEHGMPAPVGVHEVAVLRNGRALGAQRVRFAPGDTALASVPCIDAALAQRLDIAAEAMARDAASQLADPVACVVIAALVPGARAQYDAGDLALRFEIPHAALAVRAADAIDPSEWDRGMPALRLDYGLTIGHESRDVAPDRTRTSLRWVAGANLGSWRLRHRVVQAWQTGATARRDTLGTTLSTDVPSLGAQFVAGDFHTSGLLFDAIGVRGARLESDDRMLPPSMSRYAPVVRGVAATQARVQVRQQGRLLADTFVAPGPFALRDLQPLGYGGALDVRVLESDGTVQAYAVPHAAIPGLLRRGRARFGVVAGTVPDGTRTGRAPFAQGAMQRGLRDRVTVQAGVQLAPDYLQVLGGVALSTRFGAFAIDHARSRAALDARVHHGANVRLAYAGRLPGTGTTVDVAAWRHGNSAFRSVRDALRDRAAQRREASTPDVGTRDSGPRERTRFDLSLQQRIGERGGALHATFTGSTDQAARSQRSAQFAWSRRIGRGTLHASLGRTQSASHGSDTRGALVLSLPIAGPHAVQAQWRDGGDAHTMSVGATGHWANAGRTSYAIGTTRTASATRATHAASAARVGAGTTTHHASISHATGHGVFGVGAVQGDATRQQSASADGAFVLHRHGFTAGPPLGETIALVRASDGGGARLDRHRHIRLDRHGHALVPALAPYRAVQVGVDPAGAAADVHFDWTEARVVARAGAIVDIVLPTTRARTAWLRPWHDDGTPLPFGARVVDASDATLGTIGRDGAAWVRVPLQATTIDVHGPGPDAMRCRIALEAPSHGAPATGAAHAPIDAHCAGVDGERNSDSDDVGASDKPVDNDSR